jgi:hypothetical protein
VTQNYVMCFTYVPWHYNIIKRNKTQKSLWCVLYVHGWEKKNHYAHQLCFSKLNIMIYSLIELNNFFLPKCFLPFKQRHIKLPNLKLKNVYYIHIHKNLMKNRQKYISHKAHKSWWFFSLHLCYSLSYDN